VCPRFSVFAEKVVELVNKYLEAAKIMKIENLHVARCQYFT